MNTPTSLEFLLQTLVNSPEEDKRALIRSAIGLLREVCNTLTKSNYSKFQQTAESARQVLDQVLLGKVGGNQGEGADEEEFLESGDMPAKENNISQIEVPATAANPITTPSVSDIANIPININTIEESISSTAISPQKSTPPSVPSNIEIYPENLSSTGANVMPRNYVPANPAASNNASNLLDLIKKWNSKAEPWLQITIPQADGFETFKILIQAASAVRSNLLSATISDELNKEEVKRFEKYWKLWCQEIELQGFEITPSRFGRIEQSIGDVIFSCRPSLTQKEIAVLVPGIQKNHKMLLNPVTLVTMPPDLSWPDDHQDRNLPAHWRAVLGELELLLKHLQIQNSVVCAIEGINKNRVETLVQSKEAVISEIIRRGDALRNSLQKKDNIYRLATNFWRVLECFWAIFHDDDRPNGYSFFDRIRRRVQSWQSLIRQHNQLYVRNFDSSHDSLASVNKYLGNIILQSKQGIPPGAILRELRPSVIVKVDGVTRLLKGRVIAT